MNIVSERQSTRQAEPVARGNTVHYGPPSDRSAPRSFFVAAAIFSASSIARGTRPGYTRQPIPAAADGASP
jgi:hypothetical protein